MAVKENLIIRLADSQARETLVKKVIYSFGHNIKEETVLSKRRVTINTAKEEIVYSSNARHNLPIVIKDYTNTIVSSETAKELCETIQTPETSDTRAVACGIQLFVNNDTQFISGKLRSRSFIHFCVT